MEPEVAKHLKMATANNCTVVVEDIGASGLYEKLINETVEKPAHKVVGENELLGVAVTQDVHSCVETLIDNAEINATHDNAPVPGKSDFTATVVSADHDAKAVISNTGEDVTSVEAAADTKREVHTSVQEQITAEQLTNNEFSNTSLENIYKGMEPTPIIQSLSTPTGINDHSCKTVDVGIDLDDSFLSCVDDIDNLQPVKPLPTPKKYPKRG